VSKIVNFINFKRERGKKVMSNKQKGFSLIELLVVVTIVGIIAALAVPYLKKAIYAAENGAVFATIRIMSSGQVAHYTQRQRYARLDELNAQMDNVFGTTSGNTILRRNFTFTMSPANPTDADLKNNFTILASKTTDIYDVPYVISLSADGEIVQIIP
jgi:prepilin-type N-terminal cleavage/methylation domain-containing protein